LRSIRGHLRASELRRDELELYMRLHGVRPPIDTIPKSLMIADRIAQDDQTT
jgi:hypothetical protein